MTPLLLTLLLFVAVAVTGFVCHWLDTHPRKDPRIVTTPNPEQRAGSWMQTFTGRRFWPLDPRPEDVRIVDIAHALSRICRYGGHVRDFYSVAEHSVQLSYAVAPEHALWALMHDAAEAYIGDMVRPLKQHMPEFQAMEDRILGVIAEAVALPFHDGPGLIPDAVKEADSRILLDERAALMEGTTHPWAVEHLQPLGVTIFGWPSWVAEAAFLARFEELGA